MADWLIAPLKVIEVLESLNMPYVIGGSVATMVLGIPRLTNDTDLIVDFKREHLEPFVLALEKEFYIELAAVEQAIGRKGNFNLLHNETMFKVDIFVAGDSVFERAQLERRIPSSLNSDSPKKVWLLSAEDNILAKLHWFRMGEEVSERQWRDVLGILKTRSEELDKEYMHKTAAYLNILDLLERALTMAQEE